MELVFRVGSTGLVLNNKSKCTKNCVGLDEEQSKERPYIVVEKYYVSTFAIPNTFLEINIFTNINM